MYTETPGSLPRAERRLFLAVLILAAALRLPPLPAGLPYIGYVDEGHVLHQTTYMLARDTCSATGYSYPPLPACTIAAVAILGSPLYRLAHGRPLAADLSPSPYRYYDTLAPAELLVAGRGLTFVASLGIVALTGLLARRLAGPAAGLFAALAAALLPALVIRGAIVIVDVWAAFFATAALLAAEVCRQGTRRPAVMALWTGVLAGLAGMSKYPVALICLPVALALLLSPGSMRTRLSRLGLAGGAALATAGLVMPALVLEPRRVIADFTSVSEFYHQRPMGSYWHQLVERSEWDLPYDHPEAGLPFLVLSAAGLAWGLARRRSAPAVAGLLLFAGALALLLSPYPFRPLRNFLSLAPVACVGAGLAFTFARERLPRPRLLDAAAVAGLFSLYLFPLIHHARTELGGKTRATSPSPGSPGTNAPASAS